MIFSPIVAVALTNRSFNVPPSTATVNASSTLVALALIKVLQVLSNNSKNCSFLATKSVSELISTTIALLPSITTFDKPSAAILSAFLAALEIPFCLNQSIAFAISPSVSVKAFLQSIIPAPVFSLNSLTNAAVIITMLPP